MFKLKNILNKNNNNNNKIEQFIENNNNSDDINSYKDNNNEKSFCNDSKSKELFLNKDKEYNNLLDDYNDVVVKYNKF